jgi:hypothetical protein
MLDPVTIIVIFVAGLLAIGVAAYMLNRAWGDFPRRAGPYGGTGGPPRSPEPARDPAPADDDAHEPELPAGAPEGGLIPVTEPTVRAAVERALERPGSPYAAYFIRDGDRLYLAAHRIADPLQRAQVTSLFQRLNSGDFAGLNFSDLIGAIQKLGR